jgi:oligopeptide transport system substrate-binding protein
VAKSVDAADLKSAFLWKCGFKSRRPHQSAEPNIAEPNKAMGKRARVVHSLRMSAQPATRHPAIITGRWLAAALLPVMLGACGLLGYGGPVRVGAIGTLSLHPDAALAMRSEANALLVDGVARGLVGHDADGQIEAGLAGRWTVIDGGRSYIFRLRDARWADGREVKADDVVILLRARLNGRLPAALRGELSGIRSIRAMTDKVIEIQLVRPLPNLLDLLASPTLGLSRRAGGWGPLTLHWQGRTAMLAPAPRAADGAEQATPAEEPPALLLWGGQASTLLAQYAAGDIAVVMGGRFEHWPLITAADIDVREVRRDPVAGLFGLAVVNGGTFLNENLARDAVAMTIDRTGFIEALGVADWSAQAAIRPPVSSSVALPSPFSPAWIEDSLSERRRRARAIVADWQRRVGSGTAPMLRIALPAGPGADLMFVRLRHDLGAVGITARRVTMASDADLRLIDEVAPSNDPGWYLRRLGCNRGLLCDSVVQPDIDAIAPAADDAARAAAISAADEGLTRYGAFIPIALPLRFTIAPRNLEGLRPNVRGRHSLIRLLPSPN